MKLASLKELWRENGGSPFFAVNIDGYVFHIQYVSDQQANAIDSKNRPMALCSTMPIWSEILEEMQNSEMMAAFEIH